MTAIVGVMNRHAIAVAADSAETIGNGIKIYNKANKIITLSKYHPIGVAIYGSASLNNIVPWEIVIKDYRQKLQDKSFDTLNEYIEDFFITIISNPFFTEKRANLSMLNNVTLDVWKTICRDFFDGQLPKDLSSLRITEGLDIIDGFIDTLENSEKIESVIDINQDGFIKLTGAVWKEIKNNCQLSDKTLYSTLLGKISKLIFLSFTRKSDFLPFYSGLAFFGYGEKEYYPSLIQVKVSSIIDGKISWYIESKNTVTNENDGIICPMAQSDVMHTIIGGVDPVLQKSFVECTEKAIHTLISQLHVFFKKKDPIIANNLLNLNIAPILDVYTRDVENAKAMGFIAPLMNTIAMLEKEDLAEVAENLIYLTSLKRKITPNMESVGGPVDVAIVSKGDGFIWLKRKQYFDPNLNMVFIEKYLK